jgi:hypothetical protein
MSDPTAQRATTGLEICLVCGRNFVSARSLETQALDRDLIDANDS